MGIMCSCTDSGKTLYNQSALSIFSEMNSASRESLFKLHIVLSHLVIFVVIVIEVNVLPSGASAVGLAASGGILLSCD